jgi:hypothetical protein
MTSELVGKKLENLLDKGNIPGNTADAQGIAILYFSYVYGKLANP